MPPVDRGALAQIRWLYRFQDWARPRLLGAAGRLSLPDLERPGVVAGANGDGSILDALTHVVGAEMVWVQRWAGGSPARFPDRSAFPSLGDMARVWSEVEAQRSAFLGGISEADLAREVRYVSIVLGREEALPLGETLLHVCNHTTHHRGELCSGLTALGSPPESVDLIDYMRMARDAGHATP